jgi:hypothetical protein
MSPKQKVLAVFLIAGFSRGMLLPLHFSPLVLSPRAMAPISGEILNYKGLFSRGMLLSLHFSPLVLSPRAMAPISGEILK